MLDGGSEPFSPRSLLPQPPRRRLLIGLLRRGFRLKGLPNAALINGQNACRIQLAHAELRFE